MPDAAKVTIATAKLRRILHHYNNLTARILTRAEVALLEGDAAQHAAALEAICQAALDLGDYTKQIRAELLGDG